MWHQSCYVYNIYHTTFILPTCVERLKMNSVKSLAESPDLHRIPSIYAYSINSTVSPASDLHDEIPTIDFSLLTSTDPDIRSQVIQELDIACKDWGFFRVLVIYYAKIEPVAITTCAACFKDFFNES